ncbi:orotate phosphoribosyltransferase [Aureitalea marina]|uniref:Orotate phosphoribosyltransferase n=1 Tax=Aureitalea marina TaxID=930804 RepID=A0A2S7KMF2_9FLAO|nr:orotate phosphoribosyltransferase [Aureitalea marina]PQB03778.1 orotate phosphoribosyltransferase [Aureitalea marina]
MELTSKQVEVSKSADELCDWLSDVKNFESLMPESISKFEVIGDQSFVFALKGMPEIGLEVKSVNKPDQVALGAISDKIPFNLVGDFDRIDDNSCKAMLTFSGDFNPMMSMMIKGPINSFLETLIGNISKL